MTSSGGGQELGSAVNPHPIAPTYDIVMSQKTGEVVDTQDPHWLGDLLPSAHSRSDERAHAFWDGQSVLD